jgi:hypothetical protein
VAKKWRRKLAKAAAKAVGVAAAINISCWPEMAKKHLLKENGESGEESNVAISASAMTSYNQCNGEKLRDSVKLNNG